MNKNLLVSIIAISIVFIVLLKFIFVFLEIPTFKYGIYLYWSIAIGILTMILPKKTGVMFSS